MRGFFLRARAVCAFSRSVLEWAACNVSHLSFPLRSTNS
ncbi:hypothetical protein L665_01863 [Ralstonia solanacearum SD54]|nr:hypothetical protein F504_1972 [Ralstonia pseudosolanacearum FQY_4]ANH32703.1 hypothetical protein A3768_1547 [Ralstonia solanacearum]ESS49311.1 hypothetical protein L665_01863 [Ralstonia solanacearum SD54]